jgi:hypothetical protein
LIIHEDRFDFLTGRPYADRAEIYYRDIIDAKIATNLITVHVQGKPEKKEEVRINLGLVISSLRIEAYAAVEDKLNQSGIPVSM